MRHNRNNNPRRIVHIITDLGTGGAELMLYRLLSRIDRRAFEPSVICLTGMGPTGPRIRELGIPVHALGMCRGHLSLTLFTRLTQLLRAEQPDIVQTWMYHADLLGGLASAWAGCKPIIWSIHHTQLDPSLTKRTTLWTARLCALLSRRVPTWIVCCAESACRAHVRLGYAEHKMSVIPNGFDVQAFHPDEAARASVRLELGLAPNTVLIGLVARFHPLKDHGSFLHAAGLVHARFPDVHWLLCGDGVTGENPSLAAWMEEAGISDVCHLLGRRDDIPRLTAALDIASSSSISEAFSSAIGEAMACAIPCVVTDVGDSRALVADTGVVVPSQDSQALAAGWLSLLEMSPDDRRRLGALARQRIAGHFTLSQAAGAYENLYRSLLP